MLDIDKNAREQMRAAVLRLAQINETELDKIISLFTLKNIPKKTVIIHENESSDKLNFVIRGLVRIFYRKDDREVTNWFIEENNFFAATSSLFTGQKNVYIYETLEDTTVLETSYSQLEKLFEKSHDLEHLGRKLIEYYYALFLKKSHDMMFLSAEERYQGLLQQHPEWMNRIPLKYIASYLGLTQETLSRLRAVRI